MIVTQPDLGASEKIAWYRRTGAFEEIATPRSTNDSKFRCSSGKVIPIYCTHPYGVGNCGALGSILTVALKQPGSKSFPRIMTWIHRGGTDAVHGLRKEALLRRKSAWDDGMEMRAPSPDPNACHFLALLIIPNRQSPT